MVIHVKKTLASGIEIGIEAPDPRRAFYILAVLEEALGETVCGHCGSPEIKMEHRTHDSNDFYSYRCSKCSYQLDMGQPKATKTLFPKRTLPDGTYDTTNHGWYHYTERRKQAATKHTGQTEPAPQQPAASDPAEFF